MWTEHSIESVWSKSHLEHFKSTIKEHKANRISQVALLDLRASYLVGNSIANVWSILLRAFNS